MGKGIKKGLKGQRERKFEQMTFTSFGHFKVVEIKFIYFYLFIYRDIFFLLVKLTFRAGVVVTSTDLTRSDTNLEISNIQ